MLLGTGSARHGAGPAPRDAPLPGSQRRPERGRAPSRRCPGRTTSWSPAIVPPALRPATEGRPFAYRASLSPSIRSTGGDMVAQRFGRRPASTAPVDVGPVVDGQDVHPVALRINAVYDAVVPSVGAVPAL